MLVMWCWVAMAVVASVVVPGLAIVGGEHAALPDPDAPVVFVQKYGHGARIEGIKRNDVYVFQGLRYAIPPVGRRRFQRPTQQPLLGDVTARAPCSPCPQMDHKTGTVKGNEDCLCLNVYTPVMPGDGKSSAVIVFLHGGNYKTGSSVRVGGKHFAERDTILVAPQYRLGSLGLLSTGDKVASGNMALFDMRLALNWVKDYIEFFGGDPKRIMLMGHASGGTAASLLAMSAEARGARGVAALSGAPLSPAAIRPPAAPNAHLQHLASRTNCPSLPTRRFITCLKALDAEAIVKADRDINIIDNMDTASFLDEISGRSGVGARVEGGDDRRGLPPLISEKPEESIKNKQDCFFVTGVNSAETARAVYGQYNNFLKAKLEDVKDFVSREVVGGLRNITSVVRGLLPLPREGHVDFLSDYYEIILQNSLNSVDGLAKVAEATADAFFNLPAVASVKAWRSADGTAAFMYSFEHLGNLTKGAHFLPGLALTDPELGNNNDKISGPAHGDELAYLFEPQDEDGNPIEQTVSSTDGIVRENFVSLFTELAKNMGRSSKSTSKLPTSSEQYLKIRETISLEKDFRLCQMGLWGNDVDKVTSALCKGLLGNILKLPNELGNLPGAAVGTLTKPLPLAGNNKQKPTIPLPGILGKGKLFL